MQITKKLRRWRDRRRARVQRELIRHRYPRFAFAVITILTGLAGFAMSAGLHSVGMTSMGLRYGLAVSFAYGVFIFLVWLWLRREWPDDAPDILPSGSGNASESCGPGGGNFGGEGGNFGGGGASADYVPIDATADSAGAGSDILSGAGEVAGSAAGEGCAPVILVLLLLAAVGAAGWWVLSLAPALAAEFLVDAMLMALLYRRLRRYSEPVLLTAIVLRTRAVFGIVLLVVVLAGVWAQIMVPSATTLGQVWTHKVHGR